ncbi:MAG: IclR family transcriptional regulator [Pseudomonadota bacterium]
MNDVKDPKVGAGTVHRTMSLMTALADFGGPVSVRHIAGELGLAPSTTHRLLNLLVTDGFAAFDPKSSLYSVGPELYRISAKIAASTSPARIARNCITELAKRYDETVLFGLWMQTAGKIAFVERADGQKKLLYLIEMNTPLSLVWGASGKAALAFLPDAEIARILKEEGPSPVTGQAPPTADELNAELAEIRRKGFSVSHGQKLPGALGIAAPVFGPSGVLGTICMTMPRERAPTVSTDDLGAEIAAAALSLTGQIGGEKP